MELQWISNQFRTQAQAALPIPYQIALVSSSGAANLVPRIARAVVSGRGYNNRPLPTSGLVCQIFLYIFKKFWWGGHLTSTPTVQSNAYGPDQPDLRSNHENLNFGVFGWGGWWTPPLKHFSINLKRCSNTDFGTRDKLECTLTAK